MTIEEILKLPAEELKANVINMNDPNIKLMAKAFVEMINKR